MVLQSCVQICSRNTDVPFCTSGCSFEHVLYTQQTGSLKKREYFEEGTSEMDDMDLKVNAIGNKRLRW